MNTNERLDLIERVDHASGDQAKLTLKYMILKCTVKQNTIARAIRDAIERHTPTPTIIYQQPDPVDDDDAARSSSSKKSHKKKRAEDGGSQDEETVVSKTSKRQSTRGEINADPLVEKLILKKSKSKLSRYKKRSDDHDEQQNSPDVPRKNKPKPAPKPGAESEQHAHAKSLGQPSKQKHYTVIDLISSSDDETCDIVQSENESMGDKSSEDDSSDNDSSDDDSPAEDSSNGDSSEDVSSEDNSSDIASSDDEGTGNEQQDDAMAGGSEPSQNGSSKNTTQAMTGGGEIGHDAARAITVSMARTSIQNDGFNMRPSDLSKKRKALEQTVGEAHSHHEAQTATDTQANKRPKRIQPGESQNVLDDRTCRGCGVLFSSVGQLLGHRLHCKSAVVTPTADPFTNYSATDEKSNSAQLRVHPNDGVQATQALSAPQPGFDTSPTNDCMDTDSSPLAPAHFDSKAKAPYFKLPLGNADSVGAASGPCLAPRCGSESHDIDDEKIQSLIQGVHLCKRCNRYYQMSHNEAGACQKGHPGT